AQLWAEGKRKMLVIVPASLRKQWQNELLDKFDLPSEIIESRPGTGSSPGALGNLFAQEKILICSMHYAYRHIEDLRRALPYDLVVIDEAHHFRNVWRKNNKMGQAIREAVGDQPKLLLTATPLHNNLMELYGLVSFIDEQLLGTPSSFKLKFMADSQGREANNLEELRERLEQVSTRVLRRQVQEYIRYTERRGMLEPFTPYRDEQELYDKVSAYLQRERLAAVNYRQRALMLLVYRKLLASSSFAIAGTLESLIKTLQAKLSNLEETPVEEEAVLEDLDGFEEEIEELGAPDEAAEESGPPPLTREEIERELQELQEYHQLAVSIKRNAKGDALLVALRKGFQFNRERGWPEK
ncbi:TPA: DEAD/DEAH box helicase, partial [Candidatus Bipolaricaulota bacterium]|nr:DEAD/DEAH box helicase [Candidatus Bipolaricaulota bacterium]